jgi:hypothetical protein
MLEIDRGSVPLAAIGSVAMIVGAALMSRLFIAQGREATCWVDLAR